MLGPLNDWLGGLFASENRDRTVEALLASQGGAGRSGGQREAVRKRLADAEKKLRRLQDAIAAGVDPAALVEATNAAQAERVAAQAQLEHGATPDALDRAEVYAMIDSLSEMGRGLDQADPHRLQDWYEALRLEMTYDAEERAVDVTIRPARRDNACVRGGIPTHFSGQRPGNRAATRGGVIDSNTEIRCRARLAGCLHTSQANTADAEIVKSGRTKRSPARHRYWRHCDLAQGIPTMLFWHPLDQLVGDHVGRFCRAGC